MNRNSLGSSVSSVSLGLKVHDTLERERGRFCPCRVAFFRHSLAGMRTLLAALIGVMLTPWASAAETQNGLQLSVAPKTISRNDSRYAYYFSDTRINRMMALQVVVKNASSKPMPEGTLDWKILVVSRSGGSTLYSGSEKIPALKTAESKEFLVGSAQITGWRDASYQHKDKLEHQIVVQHSGQQTARVASTPQFETLARHASRAATHPTP